MRLRGAVAFFVAGALPAFGFAFAARLPAARPAAVFAAVRGAAAAFFFPALARAPLAVALGRAFGAAAAFVLRARDWLGFAAFRFRAPPASGAALPTGFFLLVAIGGQYTPMSAGLCRAACGY
jgi:hypothetical protein